MAFAGMRTIMGADGGIKKTHCGHGDNSNAGPVNPGAPQVAAPIYGHEGRNHPDAGRAPQVANPMTMEKPKGEV